MKVFTRNEAIERFLSEIDDWSLEELIYYVKESENEHLKQQSDLELEDRLALEFGDDVKVEN